MYKVELYVRVRRACMVEGACMLEGVGGVSVGVAGLVAAVVVLGVVVLVGMRLRRRA